MISAHVRSWVKPEPETAGRALSLSPLITISSAVEVYYLFLCALLFILVTDLVVRYPIVLHILYILS